jgi:alpha-tubulin suppressor-like RCC1 family protein
VRRRFFAKAGAVGLVTVLLAVVGVVTPALAASKAKPSIKDFTVSPSGIVVTGNSATVTAVVTGASKCVLSAKPAIVGLPISFKCKSEHVSETFTAPSNTSGHQVEYKLTLKATGAGGSKGAKTTLFVEPPASALTGAVSVASGSASSTSAGANVPDSVQYGSVGGAKYGAFCAVMTDETVECWGDGETGTLGNGAFDYSNAAVQVVGVGGTGVLSDVESLAGNDLSFCALLYSGSVDCWGYGFWGDLGNGVFYPDDPQGYDVPVQVSGVGGSGVLSGVSSITGDGNDTYCAVLTSEQVVCWGLGAALGNGVAYPQTCSSPCDPSQLGSATPVQVLDPDGVDALSGVQSLTAGTYSFCAVLVLGGVDCWGSDNDGQDGDGSFMTSGDPITFTPTAVVGVGGTGTLSGATGVVSDGNYSFCATVTSGGADCWGWGQDGELGNGVSYPDSGSGTPVQVSSEDGTTTLSDVESIASGGEGFCALLTSGNVDCWGTDEYGALGDGVYSNTGYVTSETPVNVIDTTGEGELSGVAAISGGLLNYCATLESGGIDCWGQGNNGSLGNGNYYGDPVGDPTPSQVLGVDGGYLNGVQQVSTAIESGNDTFCALLDTSGQVACWGFGNDGELGDGSAYQSSATPVDVEFS